MAAAEATVLKLMQRDNKPFGLQTLVDLLAHQGLKKAAISKALDALAESGKVVAKASEAQAQHAQQGAPTLHGTHARSRTGMLSAVLERPQVLGGMAFRRMCA